MMHLRYLLSLLGLVIFALETHAQVSILNIESRKLGSNMEVWMYNPMSASKKEADTSVSLIVVLDAESLFDLTVAQVNYLTQRNRMPPCMVVGINVGKPGQRILGMQVDRAYGFPIEGSVNFIEFVSMELVPKLRKDYRINRLSMVVGATQDASLANYFLFDVNPVFNSFICISPHLPDDVSQDIANTLKAPAEPVTYYLATTPNDLPEAYMANKELNTLLASASNDRFQYVFDEFNDVDEFSITPLALSKGILEAFAFYQPISSSEFKEKILTMDGPVIEYIYEKQLHMDEILGEKTKVKIIDIIALYTAIEKREQWDTLKELSELAEKQYPETVMADFFMSEYYERLGEPKKAMKSLDRAFPLEPVDFMTKELILDRKQAIKDDFGW